ncbi:receptor-like protein 12 [Durio zibethinus]|uniref:Receptor-like protein 12 n=1 Tax=Durio zibethinus TaxID=66656 RepID=A0A6P5WNQ2_DURZI|nr:receptor-like protein 12 [Durio zibethinus]
MLQNLQVLILRFNRFHGPLNISLVQPSFSSLQIIDLSQNEFNGLLPTNFFQNLDAMKYATELSLADLLILNRYARLIISYESFNRDGQISVNVTSKRSETELQLMGTLLIFTAIDFSNNRFNGKIPQVIGELRAVQVLNLSHNSLTGHIPPSLGNLVALESLDFSSNKLSG